MFLNNPNIESKKIYGVTLFSLRTELRNKVICFQAFIPNVIHMNFTLDRDGK